MKVPALAIVVLFFCIHSAAQNVGIGTSNPVRAKLEVHGASDATSAIFGGESSGISLQRNWPGIGFNQYYNGGSRYIANGHAAVMFVDPGSGHMALDLFPAGTANAIAGSSRRALVVSSEGRLSIGTANLPPSTLFVARGTGFDGTAAFEGTTYRSHFNYASEENTYIRAGKNNGRVIVNDVPGGKVAMGNGSGFVGINSSDPFYTLELRQAPFNQVGHERGLLFVSPRQAFDNWEMKVSRSASQNNSYLYFSFNEATRVQINPADGSYNSISDARLKSNIQLLPPVMENIRRLRPVSYEMGTEKNRSLCVGFLAQEVKGLFPQLVHVNAAAPGDKTSVPDLHTMNYAGFGVLAIKAIQEQQEQIEILRKENEAMKARLDKLEKFLAINQ